MDRSKVMGCALAWCANRIGSTCWLPEAFVGGDSPADIDSGQVNRAIKLATSTHSHIWSSPVSPTQCAICQKLNQCGICC